MTSMISNGKVALVLSRLDVLASQGRLSGHWKQQVSLAEQIAERRQPRARGGP